eukprot:CAMPEP_0202444910 /NCGR_PEP_ID=MMETSP1360-20130828/3826_1 /ASSEMBLY_ACC=CAM_ASM_000848 /TAXON_ID=515479 /ORGANISM="Licmophora paradoxa, Strain CCMP2313" /LENGTH=324 /DNA_ID=CAMNT_0049061009 /DNA_START=23 /DNA_END=997 /DNA_ORIENTATION=-
MSAAAARVSQAPLTQWITIGLGAFYLANPEKFLSVFQRTTQLLLSDSPGASSVTNNQQPLVIHTVQSSANGRSTVVSLLIQFTLGATVCWGSYAIMVNVLPEAAKNLLPVTKSVFNNAVTSLGKGLIQVRDSLSEQIHGLLDKQDDLGKQQEETHEEVLHVKDTVGELKDDFGIMQDSIDKCHLTLTESEKKQLYIARGVRLLSRGVSSISKDAQLVRELEQFHRDGGMDFRRATSAPAGLRSSEDLVIQPKPKLPSRSQMENPQQSTPIISKRSPLSQGRLMEEADDPENEVPATPARTKGKDLGDVKALLSMLQSGNIQFTE